MQAIIGKKDISKRSALIDCFRGCIVISMVLYHVMWDLVNLFDINVFWFHDMWGFSWQQATCCAFILLSGFCSAFGTQLFKRGCVILGLGAMVSIVTVLYMPEEVILFGILTFMGSAMIFVGMTKKCLVRISAEVGLIISLSLFAFTREVNNGMAGAFLIELLEIPKCLYRNDLTAYLGFPPLGFRSTDYFSLIPWIFLFLSGFFLHGIYGKRILSVRWKGIPIVNLIGRKALLIYVLHQPIVYALLISGKYIF